MASVIANQLDKSDARKLAGLSKALQKASGENRQRIVNISRQLQNVVEKLSRDLAVKEFGRTEKEQILADLLKMGVKGEFRDYIGAEQAVMAIELIIIDMDKKTQSREQLDDLYKLVKNDETYQPVKFMNALKKLKAVIN
jgi:hypothetical protein